jgi:hypothetical protein
MRLFTASLVCVITIVSAGCNGESSKSDLPRSAAKSLGNYDGPGEAKAAAKASPEGRAPLSGGAMAKEAAEAVRDGMPAVPAAPVPATVEPMAGTDRPRRPADKGLRADVLTAGNFDDNLNPEFFRRFTDMQALNHQVPGLAARMNGQNLVIQVKGQDGAPVGNVHVKAATPQGGGVELTTRSDGRVVFLTSFDGLPADGALPVTVTGSGGAAVEQTVPVKAGRWDVVLPGIKPALPRNLDLTLVLDTTGSMGKELGYLKSEMKAIATAVHDKFPAVDQRYALVVYRDDGDEYVTRVFPFTRSIEEFRKNLAAQRAAGGGDEPEALHRGLEEALQLPWRSDDTVRVVFLVTDAPPHAQYVGRTMDALNGLRKQGVAVYGVKTGVPSDAAELVLRSCSLLTGSQYVFLTDDSGVGNAHGEPHIPFYSVQKLDKMMVRMIESELSGKHVDPPPTDIVRVVGRPIN